MANGTPFLHIDGLSKSFRRSPREPEIQVIDGVSLSIDESDFVIFVGPSGCGKTTLMRIASGLEHATSGRVVLDGEVISGPDRRKGVVFQSYSSFPWLTVLENAEFGLKFRDDVDKKDKRDIARHYLDLVGLGGFESFYVNHISGGMRQRLAIARTLCANPDVLFMDEPFGALDAQNREFLQVQLLEIREKERKTIVFVTHDAEEAIFLGERIFVFSARPARVIEEIVVADYLQGERTLELKDTEAFFHLRNHLLELTRAQARQTEELAARSMPGGGRRP